MKKSTHETVRALLRAHEEGMTPAELAKASGLLKGSVHRALCNMPDAYIDRWAFVHNNVTSVWCVVVPPENAPRPRSLGENPMARAAATRDNVAKESSCNTIT